MIHLLLVILSVMTWTVESKNTVRLTDGSTAPYDLEASYTNTYNKGQLRLGDEATLTLKNMGGVSVERVSLALMSKAVQDMSKWKAMACDGRTRVWHGIT